MKATFEVDLSDSAQVNALISFLQGSGTSAVPATTTGRTKRTPSVPTTTTEKAPAADDITQDQLAELTGVKVKAGHRDKVKAKLDALGAAKVSALKPEQYAEYKTYLESLK